MRKLEMLAVSPDVGAPEDRCMTRRAILATLAAAALTACSSTTVGGAKDSGTPPDDAGDSGVDPGCPAAATGALASFPKGTWVPAGAFIVGHDDGGLFAFSTTCTHRGCTIGTPSATGETLCPCHGARFDGNGAVVNGPASSPLPHFALTVCSGKVYVDVNATVAATTRTAAA